MLSLIYVSVATQALGSPEVEDLARHAAASNAEHEITGLLAYNSVSFMQLLEGNGDDVLSTMRRIEQDSRHSSITYIRQDARDHRECPDWSMRSLLTPMTGAGSADVFTGSLPKAMDLDTRILFTSFASSLRADQVAQFLEREDKLRARTVPDND